MTKRFVALICGYGVPKDIFVDPNYQAYLHSVVNWLFARYGGAGGTIVVNGGATDVFKPYKRTEAGEIKRWLAAHNATVKRSDQNAFKVVARPMALTTVENLLDFAAALKAGSGDPVCGGEIVVFCEATRAARVRRLSREIPTLRRAKIVAIDFDTSPRRYDLSAIKRNERDFLALELAAIRDPAALKRLRRFAQEKLRLMRQHSPEEAHRQLPEILARLHAEYKKSGRG